MGQLNMPTDSQFESVENATPKYYKKRNVMEPNPDFAINEHSTAIKSDESQKQENRSMGIKEIQEMINQGADIDKVQSQGYESSGMNAAQEQIYQNNGINETPEQENQNTEMNDFLEEEYQSIGINESLGMGKEGSQGEKVEKCKVELARIISRYQGEAWSDMVESLGEAMVEALQLIQTYRLPREILMDKKVSSLPKQFLREITTADTPDAISYILGNHFGSMFLDNVNGVKPESLATMQEFMGEDILKRKYFKARYPKSFRKWTKEEDEELLRLYSEMEVMNSEMEKINYEMEVMNSEMEGEDTNVEKCQEGAMPSKSIKDSKSRKNDGGGSKSRASSTARARQWQWQDLARHFGRNVNGVKLRLQKLGMDLGSEAVRGRYQ